MLPDFMPHLNKYNKHTDRVTESDKKEFINKNTFYCQDFDSIITKYACSMYQKSSMNAEGYNPTAKCQKCRRMDKKLIKNMEEKVCALHADYPGLCLGKGKFKRRPDQSNGLWNEKRFCTIKCGTRYNYFKRNKWHTVDDLPEKTKRTCKKKGSSF